MTGLNQVCGCLLLSQGNSLTGGSVVVQHIMSHQTLVTESLRLALLNVSVVFQLSSATTEQTLKTLKVFVEKKRFVLLELPVNKVTALRRSSKGAWGRAGDANNPPR